MHNKYHIELKNVPTVTYPVDIPDPTKLHFSSFSINELSCEFVEWLRDRELVLADNMPVQYFYVPPHERVPLHSDQHRINDCTKINWMIGGESSMMNWYEFKPGKTFNNRARVVADYEQTPNSSCVIDRSYVSGRADYDDVELTHSARLGYPSIVNVGRLHDFVSGSEASHIFCVVMFNAQTGRRVSWNEVPYFFADCIKNI